MGLREDLQGEIREATDDVVDRQAEAWWTRYAKDRDDCLDRTGIIAKPIRWEDLHDFQREMVRNLLREML